MTSFTIRQLPTLEYLALSDFAHLQQLSRFNPLRERLMRTTHSFRKGFLLIALSLSGLFLVATAALLWDGLRDEIGKSDIGLVLGNTVHPNGTPSDRLAARLDCAFDLYERGVFPLIMVSGALGKEGHDEALIMRDYLVSRGIPSAQIVVDSAGYTTLDSARNACAWLRERQADRILVISQYFHVPRAKLALKNSGVLRVYSAHATHFELRDLYSIPRELVAIAWYAIHE